MREKGTTTTTTNSPMMLRGLEIIRESFADVAGRVLSPSLGGASSRKQSSMPEDVAEEEKELFDLCALGDQDDDDNNGDDEDEDEEEEEEEQQKHLRIELVEKKETLKPISSSSSFLPRYRENGFHAVKSRVGHCSVMEMGPGLSRVHSAPINWTPYCNSSMAAAASASSSSSFSDRRIREFSSSSPRVDISRKEILDEEEEEGVSKFQMSGRWLKKQQRSVSSSEEAIKQTWEKQRRDSMRVVSMEEEQQEMSFTSPEHNTNKNNSSSRSVGRSVSDCGSSSDRTTWPSLMQRTTTSTTTRSRTRSLTDEDMDELRGCIDLGFGFSNDEEDLELCNTLPALELCYAITRQYNDVTGRSASSPISTSGSSSSLDRCSSGSSLQSFPLESSWRISSPGDHPSQVKTRLRHWAQAVACTVRQSF
ncbi:hypothetical protein CY35_12G032700 [Sphagnum magellanicum]|nr:hypothetical protein CY35_12G032700 [Sphagnum magellanicum]KAH9545119.1 hypothetical protein CY35_12G032700 [Sphagnum magellanicum]KAH9545120.1 hypothetical protein CY35_12G032700 [Sphagnum magellanicum]